MSELLNKHKTKILLVLITVSGYFPIAFHLLALKNDIIQLDLPVNYFISKELHRGQLPIWIYSWGLGFPLGHIFSWSIYNPITLLFATVFSYNLHTLHIEFLFYLLLGGIGLLKIAKSLVGLTPNASLGAASLYILSGVTLSSAQFLAYIAAIGVLPWVYYSFIRLLRDGTFRQGILFGLSLFLLFSWSYPVAFLICLYSLLVILGLWLLKFKQAGSGRKAITGLGAGFVLFMLLAAPLLYVTYKTLPYFNRSQQLSLTQLNFGYFDPTAVVSLLFPFTHIGRQYSNTEPLFQTIFIGVISIGVIVTAFSSKLLYKRKSGMVLYLSVFALIALILSFGQSFFLKPFVTRWLPGFGWFRFPSFYRLFFLLPASLLVGICLEHVIDWCRASIANSRRTAYVLSGVLFISVVIGFLYNQSGFYAILKKSDNSGLNIISVLYYLTLIWFSSLIFLLLLLRKRMQDFLIYFLIIDLIITSLLSLPVYAASSYSLRQIDELLHVSQNQKNYAITVNHTSGRFHDEKGNPFNSVNIYTNTISMADQYIGPLFLKSFAAVRQADTALLNTNHLFFFGDRRRDTSFIKIHNGSFKNHQFSATISTQQKAEVFLFQVWHPFWHATIDGNRTTLKKGKGGLIFITVPPGKHYINFEYSDTMMEILTILYFLTLILLLLYFIHLQFRKSNV